MRDFSIDLIWTKLQIAITGLGGWLGYVLGGLDGFLIALVVFMTIDYATGIMCAVVDKKLSSAVGFRGIFKKVLILMLVGIANVIDVSRFLVFLDFLGRIGQAVVDYICVLQDFIIGSGIKIDRPHHTVLKASPGSQSRPCCRRPRPCG